MNLYENREYNIEDPLLPQLFMQSWQRTDLKPKGCVLITHGISEHSECYDAFAKKLADQGWFVYAWDLQGHGKSQGKRGYIRDFEEFTEDLKAIISKIKSDETKPTSQFHLIGHSMGGLITLQALISKNPPKVSSVTLSNPCLGLAIAVPKVKEAASQWLNQVWPTFTMNNEIKHNLLSRDPDMLRSYAKDPLRHTKISAPLYLGMVDAIKFVQANPEKLHTPCFFQISGQDKLVDPQASLNYFKKLTGPKKLKIYEESYHEVYNDLDRQESIDDLVEFLGE